MEILGYIIGGTVTLWAIIVFIRMIIDIIRPKPLVARKLPKPEPITSPEQLLGKRYKSTLTLGLPSVPTYTVWKTVEPDGKIVYKALTKWPWGLVNYGDVDELIERINKGYVIEVNDG